MEFDYFHDEGGSAFEDYYGFVRQVAREDFEVCEVVQRNLGRGVYGEGVLNGGKETGVVCKCRVVTLCFFPFWVSCLAGELEWLADAGGQIINREFWSWCWSSIVARNLGRLWQLRSRSPAKIGGFTTAISRPLGCCLTFTYTPKSRYHSARAYGQILQLPTNPYHLA